MHDAYYARYTKSFYVHIHPYFYLRANCIQKVEAKQKQATLTLIVSSAILELVQIDLVDYSQHWN